MEPDWIKLVARDAIHRIGSYLGVPGLESELNVLEEYTNFCKAKPLEQEHVKRLCLDFHLKCRVYFQAYLYKVLPSLRKKLDESLLTDESLLSELVGRWSNHKVMFDWLSQFFHYLNPNSIALPPVLPLNKVGVSCFRDLVFYEFRGKLTDAAISLIHQEREGVKINQELLKNVRDIFVEIGIALEYYETYFEASMLEKTEEYYKDKVPTWISRYNCTYYMQKAEKCLKSEKDRVGHYLHSSSERKLLKKVQDVLLTDHAAQLLEKEHSGCQAFLSVKDDDGHLLKQVKDLIRMYSLFSAIPEDLDKEESIEFKKHVKNEVMTLAKQAEDSASNKRAEKRDVVGLREQVLVVIELHDKNHTLFHKALKKAFEMLCSERVAGSSSAKLLATFCDNIRQKGGSDKQGCIGKEKAILL